MSENGDNVTVAIFLAKQAVDSRVLINGLDVTRAVVGVEVRAVSGEVPQVTLTLSSRVEIVGDVAALFRATDAH